MYLSLPCTIFYVLDIYYHHYYYLLKDYIVINVLYFLPHLFLAMKHCISDYADLKDEIT